MAVGDGYISKNGNLSILHCSEQKEYLEWKYNLIKKYDYSPGIKYKNNNGHDSYFFTTSVNKRLKFLRYILYTPNKHLTKKLLSKLDPLGLAIWYMDDGCLMPRFNLTTGKLKRCEMYINTCVSKEENQEIIDFFKEKYNITFSHNLNHGKYRLRCGTKEARKFAAIIKPYVKEVQCMHYKLKYLFPNYTLD